MKVAAETSLVAQQGQRCGFPRSCEMRGALLDIASAPTAEGGLGGTNASMSFVRQSRELPLGLWLCCSFSGNGLPFP